MKKILILCLLLFGCDGLGVFSHGHTKGLCIHTYKQLNNNYRITCDEYITEDECISQDGGTAENYHVWTSTNLTCDEWED